MLKTSKKLRKLLIKNNSFEFNHTKASEELSELNTVIMQVVNKKDKKLNKKIHEELAHVLIRIDVLLNFYDKKEVKKEILKKEKHLIDKYK